MGDKQVPSESLQRVFLRASSALRCPSGVTVATKHCYEAQKMLETKSAARSAWNPATAPLGTQDKEGRDESLGYLPEGELDHLLLPSSKVPSPPKVPRNFLFRQKSTKGSQSEAPPPVAMVASPTNQRKVAESRAIESRRISSQHSLGCPQKNPILAAAASSSLPPSASLSLPIFTSNFFPSPNSLRKNQPSSYPPLPRNCP